MFTKRVVNSRLLFETTDYTDYTDVFSRVNAAENGEYMGYGKNEPRSAALKRHFASV